MNEEEINHQTGGRLCCECGVERPFLYPIVVIGDDGEIDEDVFVCPPCDNDVHEDCEDFPTS